jgi:hypothetical protein
MEKEKEAHRDAGPEDNVLTVVCENTNGRTVIKISALPMELTVNKLCAQQLIGLFIPSPLAAAPRAAAGRQSDLHKLKEAALAKDKEREAAAAARAGGEGDSDGDAAATGGRTRRHSIREGDLEIIFEAHAPKIIIPTDRYAHRIFPLERSPRQDCCLIPSCPCPSMSPAYLRSSAQRGYLLLDTGYMVVRGVLGLSSMTWDVALRDVNAGMPKNAKDMY